MLTQLTQPTANLAHCKLGRHGATALAHALGANTVVTELDLTDNNLDAKASGVMSSKFPALTALPALHEDTHCSIGSTAGAAVSA